MSTPVTAHTFLAIVAPIYECCATMVVVEVERKDRVPMENLDLYQKEVITVEELRTVVGVPHEAVVKKTVSIVDAHIRDFIARSPLFFLSTSHTDGSCDVSPRGDHPGFVKVWDDKHLIFPDRPGNRRADSLLNILSNPHVGMLFLIPGMGEVLRVNGRARVVQTPEVLELFRTGDQLPQLAVVVEVDEGFIHCPRALQSSSIWETGTWPSAEELPSAKDMFLAHLQINGYKLP